MLSLLVAVGLMWVVLSPPFAPEVLALSTAGGAALCFVGLLFSGAYLPSVAGNPGRTRVALANNMALALAVALFVFFVVPTPDGAVAALATTGAFYFPLLSVGRRAFRATPGLVKRSNRVLILGATELGIAIAREITGRPRVGLDVLGFLSSDSGIEAPDAIDILGHLSELAKIVPDYDVGMIVVATTGRDRDLPIDALLWAKLSGFRIVAGEDLYERITGRVYVRTIEPQDLVLAAGFRESPVAPIVRRAVDLVGASVALLLSAPLLALTAVAIKIDSRGPVFYRQVRVGAGGRLFSLLKLRSMRNGAEAGTGPVFANRLDDRITRVGRILRRTRLDEIPQFWNVLTGDMSLVGPRPERPEFLETLSERLPLFRFRCAVKPGVTGWAQVRYGYVNDLDAFEQKLALDLYYLKHRSVVFDLLVIGNTLKTVLLCRGL